MEATLKTRPELDLAAVFGLGWKFLSTPHIHTWHVKAIKISLAFNVMVYHRSGSFVLERLWKALKKATLSSHHHMTFTDWRMQGHLTEKIERFTQPRKQHDLPWELRRVLKSKLYYVPFRVHTMHENQGENVISQSFLVYVLGLKATII